VDLSVVIPVLDEELGVEDCLYDVVRRPGVGEVIIVDGGSTDGTMDILRSNWSQYTIIESERGRAAQQNAGARAASGDTLLFLHADVFLPEDGACDAIDAALSMPGVVAGAFRTHHHSSRHPTRLASALLRLADIRSRYSSLPYGDQCLFMRADTFREVGGFPEEALMEDLVLSRRLRKRGRIHIVDREVRVSGRRFESAPVYQTLLVNVFPLLHGMGVPTRVLARLYGNPR
jgi:rSAM/selenodomain-associated transferase 2